MEIIDQRIERPWQGTLLGVFQIIQIAGGVIATFFLSIALLIGSAFVDNFIENIPIPFALGVSVLSVVFLLLIIPATVLGIFLAIGLFKGWYWTIIVALVFAILGVLGNLGSLNFFGLVFSGLSLYCCIECMRHPFYKN